MYLLRQNQSSIYLLAGDGKVSFIDVRDIAAVAIHVLYVVKKKNKNKLTNLQVYTAIVKVKVV